MKTQTKIIVNSIVNNTINAILPDTIIKDILKDKSFGSGKLIIVSIGKAAYLMAKAASEVIDYYDKGILITKYKHIKGNIDRFEMFEAGHPILDENSIIATRRALELTDNLTKDDTVLFLLSGGGSSLFEDPIISLDKLQDLNNKLLKSGANINEINAIRKHLSKVKGGNFAKHISPAHVYSIIISDVIENKLDVIASGPCYKDCSTINDCINIINKYHLNISNDIIESFNETIKEVDNVENIICSSVEDLCLKTKENCESLGYKTTILKTNETGIAKDVGKYLANKAIEVLNFTNEKTALIIGGESVVEVKGNGLGGRNQELALTCAPLIKNKNIIVFAFGSDGTDGPTDKAGGFVDGDTYNDLNKKGIDVLSYLNNNDSYNALNLIDSLIDTGPTGTNVNDVYVALINN